MARVLLGAGAPHCEQLPQKLPWVHMSQHDCTCSHSRLGSSLLESTCSPVQNKCQSFVCLKGKKLRRHCSPGACIFAIQGQELMCIYEHEHNPRIHRLRSHAQVFMDSSSHGQAHMHKHQPSKRTQKLNRKQHKESRMPYTCIQVLQHNQADVSPDMHTSSLTLTVSLNLRKGNCAPARSGVLHCASLLLLVLLHRALPQGIMQIHICSAPVYCIAL